MINTAKQFGSDQAKQNVGPDLDFKLFDITLMVILNDFFENVDFEKHQQRIKRHAKMPSMQRVSPVPVVVSWHVCGAEHYIQLQGKSYRCTFVCNFRACFGKDKIFKSFNLADRSVSVCRALD